MKRKSAIEENARKRQRKIKSWNSKRPMAATTMMLEPTTRGIKLKTGPSQKIVESTTAAALKLKICDEAPAWSLLLGGGGDAQLDVELQKRLDQLRSR